MKLLSSQKLQLHCKILRQFVDRLRLAHPVTDEHSFDIDLLIGADHYWNIVEYQVVKGPGPTAANSKIAYLLSGPAPGTNQSSTLNASILHVHVKLDEEDRGATRFFLVE